MPKDIIRYRHKDTDICVRRYWNQTQLLFNETVVDTWKGVVEFAYAVQGQIGDDFIVADFSPRFAGENIRLIINGKVVDSAWKA